VPFRPDVAVITPTELRSDRLEFLEELHRSLVVQQVRFEWVIAPNGPTAEPERIPASITRDPRVIVCARPRAGAAPARNTALNHVSARYVTFADDDDRLGPSSLEVRYRRAVETGLGWVAGLSADWLPDGTLRPWACPTPVGKHGPGDVWTYWASPMDSKPPLGHTMILARTELARTCGHGGMHKGEDYSYVAGVTGLSSGELLPDIVYHYRSHPGQWTEQSDYRDQAEYDARIFAWHQGQALRGIGRGSRSRPGVNPAALPGRPQQHPRSAGRQVCSRAQPVPGASVAINPPQGETPSRGACSHPAPSPTPSPPPARARRTSNEQANPQETPR
jgi:hypothetical protein